MSSDQAIKDAIAKTYRELSQPKKPQSLSRNWKDPEGYKYLVQWSNAVLLRYFIRLFTLSLPKSEYRRKAQVDDAGRSVVRNIEEGFKRSTTADYLNFIGFSQGSLEEVKGDVRELTEDGFLPSRPGSRLQSLGIDLASFNNSFKRPLKESTGGLEDVNFLYRPLTILYPPLVKVTAEDLTYEIFIELINKTDYLLRTLVQSLEKKLSNDQKGYQIQQSIIKSKIR